MEYFSLNSFVLGLSYFAFLFSSILVYSLICFIWKIKIVDFTIFSNPWFTLYSTNLEGTRFILGWLPVGSYIKPLGLAVSEEEKKSIKLEDLPFTFFSKPRFVRILFRIVPLFIYFISIFILISILRGNSIIIESQNIAYYINVAFHSMFSQNTENIELLAISKEMTKGNNLIIFPLLLLIILSFFLKIFGDWSSLFFSLKRYYYIILGIMSLVLIFVTLWFALWKIPKLMFSFYTLNESIVIVISFFIGLFSTGVILYITSLFVVKQISNNIEKFNLISKNE